jgi:catechol 2,3-dioxygenase-like lactoylglutathione lyase family enzyme
MEGPIIEGLGWVGTRTSNYQAMVNFCRNTLGLELVSEAGNFAEFAMPNGDRFEIFGSDHPANTFMSAPLVEFVVADVGEARAVLEAQGVFLLARSAVTVEAPSGTIFRRQMGSPTG